MEAEFNINGFVVLDNIFENRNDHQTTRRTAEVYTGQCEMIGGEQNLINISEKGIARSPFSDNKDILTQVLLNKNCYTMLMSAWMDHPFFIRKWALFLVLMLINENGIGNPIPTFYFGKPIMVQILVPLS